MFNLWNEQKTIRSQSLEVTAVFLLKMYDMDQR